MVTTKKQVAEAAVGWHSDPRCQGLALQVRPDGRRTWMLDYRVNGRQRRMVLGRADTLPADEAVRLARRHRVAIDQGRDPLAEKEAARRADAANVTLTVFFGRYMDEHAKVKKRERSIAEDRWMFETHIKGDLGRHRVPDITHHDAARLHRKLTARPAPILANRVLALLSTMMSLAERWGVRPPRENPCRFVERNPEHKTHRFLTNEQLIALGKVLAETERCTDKTAEEYESPKMVAVIRLLLFTGSRRSEILTLRWADVNLEAGWLDLPTSKTGRKLVTLNAPARQVLAALPRESEFVFPGRRGKPLMGIGPVWLRIRKRAGLDGVRLHDLRHSFASAAAGLGASLPVIGALLGHTVPQTTARYAGLADDPRRAAAEAVGKHLAVLLSPAENPAAVVPMRKRRGRRG
jgi:integrase